MSLDLEQFVSSNTRMQVIQHLRSELNTGAITADNIEYLRCDGFKVTAFATEFEFELKLVLEDSGVATSSMLALENVKPVAPSRKELTYVVRLAEILEPGDQFPRFEAQFLKI